ncbi:diguanylate cyclase/phosphodiesterase (GGDEF & EAL domain) with PAS/PAC sensor(s) [Sulfurimonas gotlandica GD1]|uniref:Diguanylate cyclase/phosphodiesterase (GGDEF & EAL domain) with PAS/PAC sensor(S) n=1 Tax=Sulfurimonas gotlandica (strain DSM 19862 / JCM 16533 / GD1) TaxID=929558 RepID=B6BNH0_SULGG|nr:bifunctional diguanylate cyclase/phosphodiesterase [Sulfurimonas gotlandica]EDZ61360.1 sensory box/ggdef domain/eal domain protein [Sulfurimonas gotlandica GD1]EHP31040.1 diguanylate cyclase/phosphodiesterase (GGDEF & EAL domain) with PAS/PAC sensor(s) [Sulfurimonas gotlandica GD1]
MIKITENNINIRNELLHLASSNLLTSSLAVIVNSIIVTIVFWNIADKIFLSIWLLSLTTILLIRHIKAKSFLNHNQKASLHSLEKSFKLHALATSLIISVGIFVLLPENKPFYQAFLTMIVAGLSAGTVMSLSIYKDLARNYLIILLAPFAIAMYKFGTEMHILMSLLITLFLMLLITFSKKHHEKIIELITSNMLVQDSEKELKLSESNFSSIFKEVPIGVFTYDKNLIITEANRSISELLNAPIHKLVNMDMKLLRDQSIRPQLDATLSGERGYYEGEYHNLISDEEIWIKMQAVPMYDIDNQIKGGLGIVEDITGRIQADKKIRQQAFYDHLTGLANRLTLNDRLEQQIARLARHNRFGAILFIDIDNFKTINDSLGHHIGDTLLKTFAQRASSIMRKEDTVARLGGDEFVILLSDLSDNKNHALEYSHNVARKLHKLMKEPIEVEEHSLYVTLSIGITTISEEEEDINVILKHADIAMYKAKQQGRNTTCFFEQGMSKKIEDQLILGSELREALKHNQFELYYQPIVETKSSIITSCEALIRWNHPTRGLIYPDDFIPYAEESGLIISIGDWVIQRACIDYKKINHKIKNISINISSKQFNQDDFVTKILKATQEYSVNPSALKLELTESVALDNLLATTDKMNLLKSHGFTIAMDDFGTGYSSLSYLKNLPFDFLKIDRSFIQHVLDNEDDASLVKTILTISKQFKFEVIAEGVEEKEHVEFLKDLDCEYYQGFVVSKALPVNEFEKFLNNEQAS